MTSIRETIARNRFRFFRGYLYVGLINGIFTMYTFIKVFQSTIAWFNIPLLVMYVGLPTLYIVSCWVAGYIDEISKMWAFELSHSNTTLNPEMREVTDNIREIKAQVSDIRSQQERLIQKCHSCQNCGQFVKCN